MPCGGLPPVCYRKETVPSPDVSSFDGRRARSAKSREAIVDATLALIDGGDLKPTAATIASTAGVSVRSVFQHFTDLEDLFVAVSDRHTNRIAALYTGLVYDGDLEARIDAFANHRARLYEAIAPMRRAALLHEPFSRVVAARMTLARSLHSLDIERAFGPELGRAAERGDEALGDALLAITGFQVWDEMRRFGGLNVERAAAALRRTVQGLFAAVASDGA
jgi:TetR/AcrR family transcriptional regulator of autoinduction and epiphytic fitness